MWFAIVLAQVADHRQSQLAEAMAVPHYASHAQCMTQTADRVSALASVNLHGRYLCMYHGEPGRQLETTQKGRF